MGGTSPTPPVCLGNITQSGKAAEGSRRTAGPSAEEEKLSRTSSQRHGTEEQEGTHPSQ